MSFLRRFCRLAIWLHPALLSGFEKSPVFCLLASSGSRFAAVNHVPLLSCQVFDASSRTCRSLCLFRPFRRHLLVGSWWVMSLRLRLPMYTLLIWCLELDGVSVLLLLCHVLLRILPRRVAGTMVPSASPTAREPFLCLCSLCRPLTRVRALAVRCLRRPLPLRP